ncbi:PepSY domain-containing protein [Terricaulis sp.]|uniref:PepSY domain-containing protein n=1 Tax=Terricaulis sp. TaxID=2768686 RepID=UPI0037844A01
MRSLLVGAFLVIGAVSAPVQAAPRPSIQPAWIIPSQDRGQRQEDILSVRDVADMLRSRFGGELVSARLERGGRPFYVIRWRMPNGDYRDFTVDAVSGAVR